MKNGRGALCFVTCRRASPCSLSDRQLVMLCSECLALHYSGDFGLVSLMSLGVLSLLAVTLH